MSSGYSGTPLAKKLGLKEGSRVLTINAPENYEGLLRPLPDGLICEAVDSVSCTLPAGRVSADDADIVHLFTSSRGELFASLARLKSMIKPTAAIWVSWYKKAAKLPTEITEDIIRDVALPLGLVDVKVCAVDEKWSGLKLVIRRENRDSVKSGK